MDPARPAGAAGGSSTEVEALYTLSEVAEATGIPLAELDRYRRRHGDRVPSIVLGETRRYPMEALEVFRTLHSEGGGDGSPSQGRRRLMSLTAQRRQREPEPRDGGWPSNGRGDRPEAGPGQDDSVSIRGAVPSVAPAGPAPAAIASTSPPAGSWRPAPQAAPIDAGTWDRPLPTEEPAEAEHEEDLRDAEVVEVVARSGAEPAPPPSRPSRPLFTLQQVHEHTGIPYPTLALYAAAHADTVPAVGERYAKLYPWEAMSVFARLHGERTPGWSAPDLVPPESVETWRRDDGIAGRLEHLQRAQDRLAEELDTLLRDLSGPLTGFARYAEQAPG